MTRINRIVAAAIVALILAIVTPTFWPSFSYADEKRAEKASVEKTKADKTEAQQPDAIPPEVHELPLLVVTVEGIEENIQRVPASVSIITGTEMESFGASSLSDVADRIPGLRVVDWGSRRNAFMYIRGIGSSRQRDSAVAVNVDGVPLLNNGTFLLDLSDIERIEVMRGPQGALYGRNTLAGVINVITRAPSGTPELTIASSAGTHMFRESKVVFRGPLTNDKLNLGVSVRKSSRQGYTDNDFLGMSADDRDTLAGRAQLQWLPSETLEVLLSIDGEEDRDGAFPLTALTDVRRRPHHISHDFAGFEKRRMNGETLRITHANDRIKFVSITALRNWDEEAGIDQDFSAFDALVTDWQEDQTQFTQEIRVSAADEDARIQWLVGASYMQDTSNDDRIIEYGSDAAALFGLPIPDGYQNRTFSEFGTTGHALFGQIIWAVTNRQKLTLGLRWDREDKEIDLDSHDYYDLMGGVIAGTESHVADDKDFSHVSPRITFAHRWADNLTGYVSIAEGYKSGGFNNFYTVASDATFDSERSRNYEIGLKSEWPQVRTRANVSAFFIQWDDQQVVQFLPPNGSIIRNAGTTQSSGVEVELVTQPVGRWRISTGLGIVDAVFDEYDDPDAGVDYDGHNVPLAPEYDLNVSVQYLRDLHDGVALSVGADLTACANFYWDVENSLKEKAYELVNLHLGLESDRWRISAWGKNLFGEEYAAIAFDLPGFPTIGQAGKPFTLGVTCSMRF